jgi:hypothetical protein
MSALLIFLAAPTHNDRFVALMDQIMPSGSSIGKCSAGCPYGTSVGNLESAALPLRRALWVGSAACAAIVLYSVFGARRKDLSLSVVGR